MISKNILRALVLPAALLFGPAQALTVGTYDIATVAGFDTSTAASVVNFGVTGSGFVAAVEDDLLTSFVTANIDGASFGLSFAGNSLVNGTGNDLVLFSLGIAQPINLTIGTSTDTFTSIPTGLTASGFAVNAFLVDLGVLNVAQDVAVNSVLLTMDTGFDFALGGALAPVPVPAAVWLFGSGLLGLAGVARRKK